MIKCKYDWAGNFSEGMAAVYKDYKYAYIDKKGKEVLGFEYRSADSFVDGVAVVWLYEEDCAAVIDQKGKEVNDKKFYAISSFHDGMAIARDLSDNYYLLSISK